MLLSFLDLFFADDQENIIRFGLTTFVQHIARFIDVKAIWKEMERYGVEWTVSEIEGFEKETDSNELSSILVLHMLEESKEKLYQFCKCIRKQHEIIADLIEYSNTSGKKVGKFYIYIYIF